MARELSAKSLRALEIAREAGVLRLRDASSAGINPAYIWRLHARGFLERVDRGVYALPGREISGYHSFTLVAKRVPDGVICLLSALRFHNIGTQNPFEVWVAIHHKARRPEMEYPLLRIIHYSGEALTEGVEKHSIEGTTVRVYSAAKTVADCFKHRNKIGLDIALEALREGWRYRKFTMDELERFGRICRVGNVMKPYLEALVG